MRARRRPARLWVTAPVALALALTLAVVAFAPSGGPGTEPSGGFAHGRVVTWGAALATWRDRPLHGAGADAFLTASATHQRGAGVRFAHALPLELAAELGAAGFALGLALYAAGARAAWLARRTPAVWLLAPAVLAFLTASLVDWPWHLAGSGAMFAAAAGGLSAAGGGLASGGAKAMRIEREEPA